MKFLYQSLLIFLCTIAALVTHASSIVLHTMSATVWYHKQTITGELKGFLSDVITLHCNNSVYTIQLQNKKTFAVNITLYDSISNIYVQSKDGNDKIVSDTVTYTLGYKPLPVVQPYATVNDSKIILHASVKQNPYELPLHYKWKAERNNPSAVVIKKISDSTASVIIPGKQGKYSFQLLVKSGNDVTAFKTFVIKDEKKITAFSIDSSHAAWIDDATIYEITPFVFVQHGEYNDITKKLPELKNLGINTIWLQPVYKSRDKGQGYEVTDYFSLRPEYGTEEELRLLIKTAKQLNMHVLFDFVPNHTSAEHPYATQTATYQQQSHYYNFYQHTDDGAMYSSQYHFNKDGFVYYFWNDLFNLNYNNEEVQQWMIEACKYWIKKFDIDGYRLDAMWAVNAREPTFGKRLQMELKSIKPDLLLLAEDKGAMPLTFKKGFDAAYDWTADTGWISQWSWAVDYRPPHNPTVFNIPLLSKRGPLLRKSLFNNGDSAHLRLRFMENNDQERFIQEHGLERTKMTAALMFSITGIPLIYNGQEIASKANIYNKTPVFERNKTIQSLDRDSMFQYYQKLFSIRKTNAALTKGAMENVEVSPAQTVVAIHRWLNNEHFLIVVNLDPSSVEAEINLNHFQNLEDIDIITGTDVLDNETFTNNNLPYLKIFMPRYTTRIIRLSKTPFSVNKEKNMAPIPVAEIENPLR